MKKVDDSENIPVRKGGVLTWKMNELTTDLWRYLRRFLAGSQVSLPPLLHASKSLHQFLWAEFVDSLYISNLQPTELVEYFAMSRQVTQVIYDQPKNSTDMCLPLLIKKTIGGYLPKLSTIIFRDCDKWNPQDLSCLKLLDLKQLQIETYDGIPNQAHIPNIYENIGMCSTLTSLSIHSCETAANREVYPHLQKLTGLTALLLTSQRDCLEYLSSLTRLRRLTLKDTFNSSTPIGDLTFAPLLCNTLKKLAVEIPHCPVQNLQCLHALEDFEVVRPVGKLGPVLRGMTSLYSLKVYGMEENHFDSDAMDAVGSLTRLEILHLWACNLGNYPTTSKLSNLTRLLNLNLGYSPGFAPSIPQLTVLTNLQILNLDNVLTLPEAEPTEKVIAQMVTLIELTLARAKIGHLWHLTSLTGLTKLDLSHCFLQSKELAVLGELTGLQSLSIWHNDIAEDALEVIFNSNQSLRTVSMGPSPFRPEVFSFLRKLTNLESLPLIQYPLEDPTPLLKLIETAYFVRVIFLDSQPKIVDEDLVVLRNLHRLEDLRLGAGIKGPGLRHLIGLNLKYLELSECHSLDRQVSLHWLLKLTTLRSIGIMAKFADLNKFERLPRLVRVSYLTDEQADQEEIGNLENGETFAEWRLRTGITLRID